MTNQESNVLMTLTRAQCPRTLDAMAAETGYPKPSIRRCISRLRQLMPCHVFGQVEAISYNESTGVYALVRATDATMG